MVAVYGPTEGEFGEWERLWNDLDRVADRVGSGYKLCVLGDMNGWIEDRLRSTPGVLEAKMEGR